MLKVFGIKNCNSMKKAFDLLQAKGLSYEFHDYKKQGIDSDTLTRWFAEIGADTVLNKKGTTWRKLTPEQQSVALASHTGLIEVLQQNTSLIKRPIIETEQGYIVGFDEEKITAL